MICRLQGASEDIGSQEREGLIGDEATTGLTTIELLVSLEKPEP